MKTTLSIHRITNLMRFASIWHWRRLMMGALVAAIVLGETTVSVDASHGIGANILIAADDDANLTMWDVHGDRVDRYGVDYTLNDALRSGDLDGDGEDEVLVVGDFTGRMDIFDQGGIPLGSAQIGFKLGDGLAVGDVDGDGRDEVLVADPITQAVRIYNGNGTLSSSFGAHLVPELGAFSALDSITTGDIDGNGVDEILIADDLTGFVDTYRANGTYLGSFLAGYTNFDAFATGDINGNGVDEILIAGDFTGRVDIFRGTGTLLRSFVGGYSLLDGFAVGNVDGAGGDEILIAGDSTGVVDIFRGNGTRFRSFDADFTVFDGFALTRNAYPDQDGDGLLDRWELFGLDSDGDGTVDVDLPAMGADPRHKDLFLELDWVPGQQPGQNDIQAMRQAFAAAPIDAGGVRNPDGQPGINLWVDTGNLADPAAAEDGAGPSSCGDGLDNGGDGSADLADPDCLVGDNLGGGNALPAATTICNLDSSFYAAKQQNFASRRQFVFRYGISGVQGSSCTSSGGWGELGGNDFVEFNHDGGTIMHELGHTLGLGHGGDESNNCKPNYVSVMNYDHQFQIVQQISSNRSTSIIDYAPSRMPNGSRGSRMLPSLIENALDEAMILDPLNSSNFFAFVDANGVKQRSRLNQPVDWNGDGDTTDSPPLTVNVNTADAATGNPADCASNTSSSETLTSHDDWTNIRLGFRGFADSADSAVNPVLEPEPTLLELQELERIFNRTDLRITSSDSVDPAVAGTSMQYHLTVENQGPNPSLDVLVRNELPGGFTVQTIPAECAEASPGTVECPLGLMMPGTSRQLVIQAFIDPSLAADAGGTANVENRATIENRAGPDSVVGNNVSLETTSVIGVSDLELSKSASPDRVAYGDALVYSLTLHNRGPSTASDAHVFDAVPSAFRVTAATASDGGQCTIVGQDIDCAFDRMLPGKIVDLKIDTVAEPTSAGRIVNSATSASNETDPELGNNDDLAETTILADFADAADPPYASRMVSGGPQHLDTRHEWLGDCVTVEDDALPTDACDDGLSPGVFDLPLEAMLRHQIAVTVNTSGLGAVRYGREDNERIYVSGWADTNRDRHLDSRFEALFHCDLAPGSSGRCSTNTKPGYWHPASPTFTFYVPWYPGWQISPGDGVLRLRLNYGQCMGAESGCIGPDDVAHSGEVEDHGYVLERK